MAYNTPEAQRIIDAVMTGECCPKCHVPTGDRHLDDCPRHPDRQASFPCIFCGDATHQCACPDPMTFDPAPIVNALGLHLEMDQ